MKIKYIITIAFFIISFQNSLINAAEIFFDSENIQIQNNGNMIYSEKGIAKIPGQNIIIEGDNSFYDKKISELVVIGNVKFFDNLNNVYVESEKAIYNQIDNTLFSSGKTFVKVEDEYEVHSEDLLYDRNVMKISTISKSSVFDNKDNIFIFNDGFEFDTIKQLISSKNTNVIDNNKNSYFFDVSKINLETKEIVGKEITINFVNSFFGDPNNDPQLKGKSTISNDQETIINKAVFSTCNITNRKCRGWELQSNEFKHNKIEKLFEYKNSWLKVFNQRVLFFPYFSHPDPSVKRKSGFLTPFYKSSNNLGYSLNTPYFYAISNSSDLTFKPRIYFDNDYILQAEYREAFKNSNLIADFSYNKDNNTNMHLFAEIDGKIDEETSYEIQYQKVLNGNYLKIHNIGEVSPIVDNDNNLSSFIKLNKSIEDGTNLDVGFMLFEDTSKTGNDKYQYILPNFNFSRPIDIDESYNGKFEFLSNGFQKLHDTNKYELLINNDFNFNSHDYVSSSGILTNYNLLLKNYNTYSQNSSDYNNKNDHELFGTIILKSELPLKKELTNSTNFLKPIIQLRSSPTNGKDISSSDNRLEYDSLFSHNRIGRSDMVEKGNSMTIGLEFEKQDAGNDTIIGFNLGNIIRDKKNDDLPEKSKLDLKRSDIVGNFFYKFNDVLQMNYNFSYDRDMNYSNYDAIGLNLSAQNFGADFDFISENEDFGDSEIIKINTRYNFARDQVINFNTTKDLKDDFTQFYRLAYTYETDCLSANFQYNKTFFRDGNLEPDQSLFFVITFKPFAEFRGSGDTLVNKYLNE